MENIKRVQSAYSALYSAVEKANRAGVYTLNESSAVLASTNVLKQFLERSLSEAASNLPRESQEPQNSVLPAVVETNEESNTTSDE